MNSLFPIPRQPLKEPTPGRISESFEQSVCGGALHFKTIIIWLWIVKQKLNIVGAPCLAFETWDSTNPAPP